MMGSGTWKFRSWSVLAFAGLLACSSLAATAQKGKQKPRRSRRETNASRQARIQRTIEDTYSHKYEVIGGGGYLRFRSGEFTKKNNEVAWMAAGNYYLNPKLAVVADARGYFGNAKPLLDNNNFQIQAPHPQINEYTFMGGGSYRFLTHEKAALSVQALGGVTWGQFSNGAKGLQGTQVGLWNDGWRPAFNIGVSADYNVYPNLALRVTPNYLATFYTSPSGGTVQNQFGFTAGVIYRFGRLHQ